MLVEQKAFDTTAATPLSPPAPAVPPEAHVAVAAADARAAAAARDRREQAIALVFLLAYAGALPGSMWLWGGQGLIGWALVSAALAGAWVLHTTRGIRGTADD